MGRNVNESANCPRIEPPDWPDKEGDGEKKYDKDEWIKTKTFPVESTMDSASPSPSKPSGRISEGMLQTSRKLFTLVQISVLRQVVFWYAEITVDVSQGLTVCVSGG